MLFVRIHGTCRLWCGWMKELRKNIEPNGDDLLPFLNTFKHIHGFKFSRTQPLNTEMYWRPKTPIKNTHWNNNHRDQLVLNMHHYRQRTIHKQFGDNHSLIFEDVKQSILLQIAFDRNVQHMNFKLTVICGVIFFLVVVVVAAAHLYSLIRSIFHRSLGLSLS